MTTPDAPKAPASAAPPSSPAAVEEAAAAALRAWLGQPDAPWPPRWPADVALWTRVATAVLNTRWVRREVDVRGRRMRTAEARYADLQQAFEEQTAEYARLAASLEAAERRIAAVGLLHTRSFYPATRSAAKGQHYCVACTTDVDDWTNYVVWPCPTAAALSGDGEPG